MPYDAALSADLIDQAAKEEGIDFGGRSDEAIDVIYTLIRQPMLRAAQQANCSPRQLSFTAAIQTIAASWLVAVLSAEHRHQLLELQTQYLPAHRVGHRLHRTEPRAITTSTQAPRFIEGTPSHVRSQTVQLTVNVNPSSPSGSAIPSCPLLFT